MRLRPSWLSDAPAVRPVVPPKPVDTAVVESLRQLHPDNFWSPAAAIGRSHADVIVDLGAPIDAVCSLSVLVVITVALGVITICRSSPVLEECVLSVRQGNVSPALGTTSASLQAHLVRAHRSEGLGLLRLGADLASLGRTLWMAGLVVGDGAVDLVEVGAAGLARAVAIYVLASTVLETGEVRRAGAARAGGVILAASVGPMPGHVVAGALFEAAHLGVAWLAGTVALGEGGVAVRLAAGWAVGAVGDLVA